MRRPFCKILLLAGIGLGPLTCSSVRVGHEVPLETRSDAAIDLEKAIAAGDHAALARYYRAMAEAERRRAETHESMARSYGRSAHYGRSRKSLAVPCHALKRDALERAKMYERLAHEEERLQQNMDR